MLVPTPQLSMPLDPQKPRFSIVILSRASDVWAAPSARIGVEKNSDNPCSPVVGDPTFQLARVLAGDLRRMSLSRPGATTRHSEC